MRKENLTLRYENEKKFLKKKKLARNRRITLSQFRQKWNIHIREYYSDAKDGTMKPTKKGISLNLDEWNEFKETIAEVDEMIERKCN